MKYNSLDSEWLLEEIMLDNDGERHEFLLYTGSVSKCIAIWFNQSRLGDWSSFVAKLTNKCDYLNTYWLYFNQFRHMFFRVENGRLASFYYQCDDFWTCQCASPVWAGDTQHDQWYHREKILRDEVFRERRNVPLHLIVP